MEHFGYRTKESRNRAARRYRKKGYYVFGSGRSPVNGYGFYARRKR